MNQEAVAQRIEETARSASVEASPVEAERAESRSTVVLGVALALASFLLTAAIIGQLVAPVMPVLTRKLDRFAANKDAYSVVFVGTSLVYHGLAPATFNEEMERLGRDERTFNFGASHLSLGEALLIEDYILSLHPKNLKRIVFDLELYDSLLDGNRFSTRDVWWHTPSATYQSLVRDFGERGSASNKLDHVTGDLKAFAMHLIAVGRVSDAFRLKWDPSILMSWDDLEGYDDDGFHSYDALTDPHTQRGHVRFLRQQASFLRKVEARRGQIAPVRRINAYARALFDAVVTRAREAGYQPFLLQMPDLYGSVRLDPSEPGADPAARMWTLPRLSFNNPSAYPDLFEVKSRFDATHLSERGAVLFTRHFARAYAKVVYGDAITPLDEAPSKGEAASGARPGAPAEPTATPAPDEAPSKIEPGAGPTPDEAPSQPESEDDLH
jgi:hypothetical protein